MNARTPQKSGMSLGDLKSGFLVFLIALPLCLGIAMASGFPPVAGILTAIVGGIVVTHLGSSRLTIKGPAAGLIVIAIGCVQELGQGDMVAGYHRALAVGVVAALIQIAFAFMRAASVGVAMSPSVVHGMLAAIGVIIISKQTHTVLGVAPKGKSPLALLAEIPNSIQNANPEILLLGVLALLILFGMPMIRAKWAKKIPAPVVVLLVTVPLGLFFDLDHAHDYHLLTHVYHLGPEYLVRLPGSLASAIAFPDFSMILSGASIKYILMFALVGTIESTLSVLAVDAMDPEKRPSNLNRDLLATGVGNLISSCIGGLPMISEIVRSRANIDAGAKSGWSNFSHGVFLLLFVALLPGLLSEIPLAALGAMLVFTGFRLASPSEFIHAKHIGMDQLAMFLTTLVTTLATDLLVGVAAGLTLKVLLHLARGVPISALFRTRAEATRNGSVITVRMYGAAIFTGLLPLRRAIATVDESVVEVIIDLDEAAVVDHTFLSRVEAMAQEWPTAKLSYKGLDRMTSKSSHPHATRRRLAL
jgi:MFS superfamily sulfate permease-like transporter